MQPVTPQPVYAAFIPRGGPLGLRRRGGLATPDSGTPSSARGRLSTFQEDVGHAAAETYLVTGLAFTLLRYLGSSPSSFLYLDGS
jgi:prenylcysteine alpha-carboxyl methylesterase